MLTVDPGNMAGGLLGISLVILLLGGYGYLLVRRFVLATRGSLFEFAGLAVLVGFLAISWIGVLLATASQFVWWLLLIGAAALVLAAQRWAPRSQPVVLPGTPLLVQIVALALIAGAAWLYARPTEAWLVFDDSAVYGIAGVHLAEMGTLIPTHEVLICQGHEAYRYFGPFRWWDACHSSLSVGFLPTPKVWAGIATWLFGRSGTVWSAPLSGVLALIAWFLFVRRGAGAAVAMAATGLLAVAFPQVWFARVLMSETFTQIALFGALYMLLLERESNYTDRPTIWGIAAALMLGLLALVRFEAVVYVGIIVVAWLVSHAALARHAEVRWPAPWVPRWLIYTGGILLVGMMLSFATSPHYYLDQMVKLMNRESIASSLRALVILAGTVALVRRLGPQTLWGMVADRPYARVIIMALAVSWLVVNGLDLFVGGGPFRGVALWLPLYLGWAGFLVGAAGLLWVAAERQIPPELYALIVLALFVATGFTLRSLVTRVHPWAIRRYVPFIIPAVALGIGLFYHRIWVALASLTAGGRRLWRWPIGVILVLLVSASIAQFGRTTLDFVDYREMEGLWHQIEELAALYPQDAILIFDHGPYGQRIPQVMELVFGYSVMSFRESLSPGMGDRLEAVVDLAHENERRVFFNVIDGDLKWQPQMYGLEGYGAHAVKAPRVRYERVPPPTEASVGMMSFLVDIYEVIPLEELSILQNETVTIPIGQGSYPYLRGVYALETDADGRPFRWTTEEARITVPIPPSVEEAARVTIALDLGAWRPPGADDTMVTVTVHGVVVAESRVEHLVEPQRFSIELDDGLGPNQVSLEIGIHTTPWLPVDHGMEDGRELGLLLYGVTVSFEDEHAGF